MAADAAGEFHPAMALFHATCCALALALTTVLLFVPRSALADVYNHELTPLQKHIAFFDRDKDGVIYPSETYQGDSLAHAYLSLLEEKVSADGGRVFFSWMCA
jgi:hypothetical protein